jgi:phosphatidylglycerophosphate synthase
MIYGLVPALSDLFHKLGMTPNQITFTSMVSGLVALRFLIPARMSHPVTRAIAFTFLYVFSYVLDCTDGYHARKYNMVSKFGDYFDHVKDTIVNVLLFGLLLRYSQPEQRCIIVFFTAVASLGFLMQMGCQELREKILRNDDTDVVPDPTPSNGNPPKPSMSEDSGSLSLLHYFCPCRTRDLAQTEKCLSWTRFLGCGTLVAIMVCLGIGVILTQPT